MRLNAVMILEWYAIGCVGSGLIWLHDKLRETPPRKWRPNEMEAIIGLAAGLFGPIILVFSLTMIATDIYESRKASRAVKIKNTDSAAA